MRISPPAQSSPKALPPELSPLTGKSDSNTVLTPCGQPSSMTSLQSLSAPSHASPPLGMQPAPPSALGMPLEPTSAAPPEPPALPPLPTSVDPPPEPPPEVMPPTPPLVPPPATPPLLGVLALPALPARPGS